jgi:hypothetical protein
VLDYLNVRSQVIDQLRESLVSTPGSTTWVDEFLDSALAAHDGLAPEQAANLKKDVLDEVVGLGPLQTYLDDTAVEEIWVNSPDHVFVRNREGSHLTSTILTQSQIQVLVERMLKPTGRRLDLSNPFVDATLADGSRLLLATMFTLILATLLAVTIDVAAVAWHQRQLAALTDAAALAGAQGLDEATLYSRGATEVIPLDPARVSELAHNYLAAANASARFANFNFSATTSHDTVLVSTTATFLPPLRGAFTGPVTLSSSALATTPIY